MSAQVWAAPAASAVRAADARCSYGQWCYGLRTIAELTMLVPAPAFNSAPANDGAAVRVARCQYCRAADTRHCYGHGAFSVRVIAELTMVVPAPTIYFPTCRDRACVGVAQ